MASTHRRNTAPMTASPRCGAKTRSGTPCRAPAIAGKVRCRMHGGRSSGAPVGNRNALKTGFYTREERAFRQALRELLRSSRELIEKR